MKFLSLASFLVLLNTIPVFGSSAPLESQDIICHGKDCYPAIFEATDEFQVVRDDQTIPKGLHVRMDFNTGVKEAKLYDGIDDPSLQTIEVFPDDTQEAVAAIPSPGEGIPYTQPGSQHVLKSPAAEQGAIRPPPAGPDGAGFQHNTNTIVSANPSDKELLTSLENLEDLSHDIYWGLRLGQDGEVVHKLNSLIGTSTLNQQIRSAAALLLGTAIQNNPAALQAALSHFYNDDYPAGPLETVMLALIHEQIPTLTVRLVYLLSELCQDQNQLLRFLRSDGLHTLRDLYDAQHANTDAKDRLRQKVSNFLLDHFLTPESLEHLTSSPVTQNIHGKSKGNHNDDPWIIVDKATIPSHQTDKRIDMRTTLSTWCAPLSESLQQWSKSTANDESQTAREHVQDAYTALNDKLESWKCSCKNTAACHSMT